MNPDGGTAQQWDFFISYTGVDRDWAEWVAWQLEEAGYRVLVQAWDMVTGSNWAAQMQEGIARAARTIALLSPAYLASVYAQTEWQAAQAADPLGFGRKLIPIRITECPRPGLLGQIVSFDLFGLDHNQARDRLLEQVGILQAGRAKPGVPPGFPDQPPTRRTAEGRGGPIHQIKVREFLTRRELLIVSGSVGSALIAATVGAVAGNEISSAWESNRQLEAQVRAFFFDLANEDYGRAYDAGRELALDFSRDRPAFARWVNNMACAATWEGRFSDAHRLLTTARRVGSSEPGSWWITVIDSNLAYVRYYLGLPTLTYIPFVEEAVSVLSRPELGNQQWLQLWSRKRVEVPDVSTPLIPPFGVLMRLYCKEGWFRKAFNSGENDVKIQGKDAQGVSLLLGEIARPAHEEALALQYADEVQPEAGPLTAATHMGTIRDLIISDLAGRTPPDESTFIDQAKSVKGAYYAWTNLADLRYFLAADGSRNLRYEYGRRVLESYRATGHGDLTPIVQIERLRLVH